MASFQTGSWSCSKRILGIATPIGRGVILDASLAAQHETSLLRRDLSKLDKAFASVGDVVPCYLGQVILAERRRAHLATKEQTAHRMRFATTGLALVMGARPIEFGHLLHSKALEMIRARAPVAHHETPSVSAHLTPVLMIVVSTSTLQTRNQIVLRRRRIITLDLALEYGRLAVCHTVHVLF